MAIKAELSRRIRQHVAREFYDDSGVAPLGIAIYSLADPRHLRLTRYIGQSSLPRRRFAQHLYTARLWMLAPMPWWVKQPKLRPLYEWLRELHEQELRLPTMIVHAWIGTVADARQAEQALIHAALANNLPLLNFERELLGAQYPLI